MASQKRKFPPTGLAHNGGDTLISAEHHIIYTVFD